MDRGLPRAEDRLAPDRRLVSQGPAERRRLLIAAALTILPFIALALWARLTSPAAWEPGILDAIALREGPFGDVFRLINSLGNVPEWFLWVAVIAAAIWIVRGARAALLVGMSLASDIAAFAVKILVERQRPETAATEHFFGPDSFAFPSGHVVRAVALAAALAWVLAPPRLRFRLALAAGVIAGVVMGYARVALGVHWPTDALGGVLLGLAWFALTAWAVTPRVASPGNRRSHPDVKPGMAVLRGIFAALVIAVGLVAVPPAPAVNAASTGIVATMSNGTKANKVLLWSRAADGSLTFVGKTNTGGRGNGKALGNQGGLTLSADGTWLYVVNPGSDSVTVFRVNGTTLTRTDVEASRGDKPVSVTVHGNLVYVLNAGGGGNIRGFRRDTNGNLTLIEASKRPLSGPNTVPVQIGFSPGGGYVFVTERATDRLVRYAINASGGAGAPQSTNSAGPEPFGFAFSSDGTLVVSEAGNHVEDGSSASSYRLGSGGAPQTISAAIGTTETAACWTAITPDGNFAYVTNTPDHSISGFAIAANGALTLLNANGRTAVTGAGSLPIDLAVSSDGDFLYVLTYGTKRIAVFAIAANGSLSSRPGVGSLPNAVNGVVAR